MAVGSRCPDPKQLQQLLLGRFSEEAAGRLEAHVEHCDRCSRLLPTLPADDTLVEAMRARATVALEPSDRNTILGLLPRLHRLRLAAPPAHGSTTGELTQGGAGLPTADLDRLAVLRPAQAPDEIGRLGPYRVLKLRGQGGMGVVFLAEDPHLQRTVALKVMRPDVARKASARERFLREARATARIEHDHIVTIFQVGEDRGVPFLAMQLLKGMSLEDFLKKKQGDNPGMPLTLGQVLKLGREIAKGLAAAHEKGLIHRDIKPANIWLDATAGGRVKILDFGLARPAAEDTRLTRLGTILGTPAYMAPEQAWGGQTDGRADLFSLEGYRQEQGEPGSSGRIGRVGRSFGVLHEVVGAAGREEGGAGLPAPHGSRVGIRLPRRHDDRVPLRQFPFVPAGELRRRPSLRHRREGAAHRQDGPGRLVPAECLGALRHARQRLGVVPGRPTPLHCQRGGRSQRPSNGRRPPRAPRRQLGGRRVVLPVRASQDSQCVLRRHPLPYDA
jgi:hypothetical protein